jgi:hypothetical protein
MPTISPTFPRRILELAARYQIASKMMTALLSFLWTGARTTTIRIPTPPAPTMPRTSMSASPYEDEDDAHEDDDDDDNYVHPDLAQVADDLVWLLEDFGSTSPDKAKSVADGTVENVGEEASDENLDVVSDLATTSLPTEERYLPDDTPSDFVEANQANIDRYFSRFRTVLDILKEHV